TYRQPSWPTVRRELPGRWTSDCSFSRWCPCHRQRVTESAIPEILRLALSDLLKLNRREHLTGVHVLELGRKLPQRVRTFRPGRPSGAACSTLQGGGEHRLGRATL